MKCEEFQHCNALSDEPEDCWFCINWKYWNKEECMISEQERKRQLLLARNHPNQIKLKIGKTKILWYSDSDKPPTGIGVNVTYTIIPRLTVKKKRRVKRK